MGVQGDVKICGLSRLEGGEEKTGGDAGLREGTERRHACRWPRGAARRQQGRPEELGQGPEETGARRASARLVFMTSSPDGTRMARWGRHGTHRNQ